MPLRREGDRIEEIENFDAWIEKTLREAIARGEFDGLPQTGQPIRIESNPFQPEMDLAFSRMRNAGMAPAWIELDREIRRMHDVLDPWLTAEAGRLAAEAADIARRERAPAPPHPPQPWYRRWWPFSLFADAAEPAFDSEDAWRGWDAERRIVRDQYLKRADQLDAKIRLFNGSVPRDLWHLEKLRMLPERAGNLFDAACPPREETIGSPSRSASMVGHRATS